MKTFILIIVFLLSFTNIGNSKTILGKAKIIDGDQFISRVLKSDYMGLMLRN